MKQASNFRLTYLSTPFNRTPNARAPRGKGSAYRRRFAPFFECQKKMRAFCTFLLDVSCPPPSIVRFRLGEVRGRSLLYGMRLVLLALILVLVSVHNGEAAETLRISLREDAAVASAKVLLKDVADLRGSDRHQIESLGQIAIVDSPVFGETVILSRNQISALVLAAAGPLPADAFAGAASVCIKLQGRQITAEEISPILRSYVLEKTSWRESEVAIRAIGNLKGIELPPIEAEFRLSSSGAVIGKRNILAPLVILQGGKILRSYWITAEISVRAEVLTAARRISAGKAASKDDIEKQFTEITDLRAVYVRTPEDVLGRVARRALLPGDPLTRDNFLDPLLVRHGETVRLRLERNGIKLKSLAKAEQDGRLGQFIMVRSADFPAFLKAQVTGRAEVTMQ
jgi:flagellar basal body P-ring formation protein FlgA